MDICFLKKSALFLWIEKKNSVYASLLFGSFCLKKSYLKKEEEKKKEKRHKGLCAKNRANSLCNRADQFKREPREFIADFHGDGNYWKLFQNENQATGILCCYSSLSFTTIS